MTVTTNRIELEISLGWARENPTLFKNSLVDFHTQATALGLENITADSTRAGFVTYVATAATRR